MQPAASSATMNATAILLYQRKHVSDPRLKLWRCKLNNRNCPGEVIKVTVQEKSFVRRRTKV
jgi:hypothetical protein